MEVEKIKRTKSASGGALDTVKGKNSGVHGPGYLLQCEGVRAGGPEPSGKRGVNGK